MITTNEKPRLWKCRTTKLWHCVKDYVLGRGTTMRGAYNTMIERHKRTYAGEQNG
jgi:hypothetical protein